MEEENEYITFELPTEVFVDLALKAHDKDMKLNDFIVSELMNFINCNLGESNDNQDNSTK